MNFFKKIFLTALLSQCTYAAGFPAATSEALYRMPLLSDKNSVVISDSLYRMKGILQLEVSLEIQVILVTFDPLLISEETIRQTINTLPINTSAEKINLSDIAIIRKNYSIEKLPRRLER